MQSCAEVEAFEGVQDPSDFLMVLTCLCLCLSAFADEIYGSRFRNTCRSG